VIYFDTAYLAKCYLNEPGSEQVRALAASDGRVACCGYGRIELMSVFHRSFREGKLTRVERNLILRQFDLDESNHLWTWLPVTAGLIERAADRFTKLNASICLRAVDALHLACAAEHHYREIFSNDRHLLASAELFGLRGRSLNRS
jgi:predicted nucleic acid-binding protein